MILQVVLILSVKYFLVSADNSFVNSEPEVQCFEFFIPILRDIAHEFSRSYQWCSEHDQLQGDVAHRRNNTKQNSKIISLASMGHAIELYEGFEFVRDEFGRCQNASRRAFVEKSAITYKSLRNCLRSTDSFLPITTESSSTAEKETEITTQRSSEVEFPSTTTTGGIDEDETTKKPGSNSVSKMELSSLLLAFNIWKLNFRSKNS